MTRPVLFAFAFVFLVSLRPSASEADCAVPHLEPRLLNGDAPLASDGALIARMETVWGGALGPGDGRFPPLSLRPWPTPSRVPTRPKHEVLQSTILSTNSTRVRCSTTTTDPTLL